MSFIYSPVILLIAAFVIALPVSFLLIGIITDKEPPQINPCSAFTNVNAKCLSSSEDGGSSLNSWEGCPSDRPYKLDAVCGESSVCCATGSKKTKCELSEPSLYELCKNEDDKEKSKDENKVKCDELSYCFFKNDECVPNKVCEKINDKMLCDKSNNNNCVWKQEGTCSGKFRKEFIPCMIGTNCGEGGESCDGLTNDINNKEECFGFIGTVKEIMCPKNYPTKINEGGRKICCQKI